MVSPDPAFWSGLKVLITGHTGFKGAWLALWLAHLGAQVAGLSLPPDKDSRRGANSLRSPRSGSFYADVRDPQRVRECLAASCPEVVFHLAAQSLVRPSYDDPVATYATNVMGTINLLESIRETRSVRAVVVVTSDKCYENHGAQAAFREDDPLGGDDPYSSSKGCQELVTAAYRRSFLSPAAGSSCRVATARAGNVIGGGDWSEDRLIPDLVRSVGSGRSAEIRHPGAIRPWQHVLEALCGYLLLAQHLDREDGNRFAEAWNFGPSQKDCRPVEYVADAFVGAWGNGARWHRSDLRGPAEAMVLRLDSSKAREHLGWRPKLGLETGLEWTFDWYRGELTGTDPNSLTMNQIEAYQGMLDCNE